MNAFTKELKISAIGSVSQRQLDSRSEQSGGACDERKQVQLAFAMLEK